MARKNSILLPLMAVTAGTALGGFIIKKIGRSIVNKMHDDFMDILMSDIYEENLWELISSTARIGPQIAVETNLRADDGKLIERPMGPPGKFPTLEDIKFNIAQFHNMPTEVETEIDMQVTIGKNAKKPLVIENPLIIAPMAYGIALTKEVKIAIAKGTAEANTATNVGAGVFLEEERAAAKYLIYQYNRGDWGKTPEILKQCDAIEIQFGQGAYGGTGHIFKSQLMDRTLRNEFGKQKGEDLVTHARHPEVQSPKDLSTLVRKLKCITGGVPIGAKIAAGRHLESDLYWICESGADFVVVDGAEAASKGSPPILQDDFGVPTVFAVYRAARWIEENGYKDQVSLIASGKIRTPGDALKACALGADCCAIGAIALYAVSHPQVTKALPFEPPTAITWYGEEFANDFDIKTGAKSMANFLQSFKLEMEEGIKALGKIALSQVNTEDLMSVNEMMAKAFNIPMVYEPYNPSKTDVPSVKKVKLT